jgi:hypothetical protein
MSKGRERLDGVHLVPNLGNWVDEQQDLTELKAIERRDTSQAISLGKSIDCTCGIQTRFSDVKSSILLISSLPIVDVTCI